MILQNGNPVDSPTGICDRAIDAFRRRYRFFFPGVWSSSRVLLPSWDRREGRRNNGEERDREDSRIVTRRSSHRDFRGDPRRGAGRS